MCQSVLPPGHEYMSGSRHQLVSVMLCLQMTPSARSWDPWKCDLSSLEVWPPILPGWIHFTLGTCSHASRWHCVFYFLVNQDTIACSDVYIYANLQCAYTWSGQKVNSSVPCVSSSLLREILAPCVNVQRTAIGVLAGESNRIEGARALEMLQIQRDRLIVSMSFWASLWGLGRIKGC